MNIVKHLALFFVLSVLIACESISPDGSKAQSTHFVEDGITKISVGFETEIVFCDDVDIDIVEITVSGNLKNYLVLKKDDDELRINLKAKPGHKIKKSDLVVRANVERFDEVTGTGASILNFVDVVEKKDFSVKLTGVSILNGLELNASDEVEFKLTGASAMNGIKVVSPNIEVQLTGASSIIDAEILTTDLDAELTGASIISVSGKLNGEFDVNASGASKIHSYNLISNNVDLELTGKSVIETTVNGIIEGSATNSSNIKYKGNPTQVNVKTSGGSLVSKN